MYFLPVTILEFRNACDRERDSGDEIGKCRPLIDVVAKCRKRSVGGTTWDQGVKSENSTLGEPQPGSLVEVVEHVLHSVSLGNMSDAWSATKH